MANDEPKRHLSHQITRKLGGVPGAFHSFLESPTGLALLFVLLIIDVIIVATSGILDIQYLVSEGKDCKDYVEKCMSEHDRRLLEFNDWETQGPSHYGRRLGSNECGDPHFGNHTLHDIEKILAYISMAILIVFVLEQLLEIAAMGCEFFHHKMHVLDFVVVCVSLLLEALVTHLPLSGLLILARVWRFTRTGHGVVEIKHNYRQVQPAAEKAMSGQLDDIWKRLTPERWKALENSLDPGEVKAEEKALVKELVEKNPEVMVRCLAFEHARIIAAREPATKSADNPA